MKVSDYLVALSLQTWDHLSLFRRKVVAELRGEKILPENHLNSMVVEVAEVLARHGYPLKYNEDYNALRHALAEEYFKEWQGYDTAHSHTSWTALREDHQNPTTMTKTITWLRSKLAGTNSSI